MNRSPKTRFVEFPWHPFLLAAFAVLSLYAHNVSEIHFSEALRALFVSLAFAGVILSLLRLLLKDWQKAALVTSLILFLFFSYGHIYNFLVDIGTPGLVLRRHRYLIPLVLICFIGGTAFLLKARGGLKVATSLLNLVLITAFLIPVFQISMYAYRLRQAAPTASAAGLETLSLGDAEISPDIYYIILDAYARDDILLHDYAYDNTAFLDDLEALGFYVARCSQSNYAQTRLSLASSLNMDHIPALGDNYTEDQVSRAGLEARIKHSDTRRLLENLGYQTVAFESGFAWTQIEDASLYLSPGSAALNRMRDLGGLNGFEVLLLKTTAGRIFTDGLIAFHGIFQADLEYPDLIHRNRVSFTLEHLARLSEMPGPKFVFAHIVSPHPPYVFDLNGPRLYPPENETEGYRDQVAYLNSQLVPLVQKLISESSTPPIIVLQADHGGVNTSSTERMAILNAYYLPADGKEQLYNDITPVNTFRLIFNTYFGGDFELREDASYYSGYQFPYRFTPIQDNRPGCP